MHFETALKLNSDMKPPHWLANNICYEVITGSNAYGVSSDNSDLDIYGWSIPPVGLVFPHVAGYVQGFDKGIPTFDQYQKIGLKGNGKTEYDFAIYNVVKYFRLCLDNNPNMIDTLYVPDECVTFMNDIGKMVRDNRDLFLHKGCYAKFKGYAYSQLVKLKNGVNSTSPKRQKQIQEHGWDTKFGYHIVRLIGECEQILTTGSMDLRKDNERLKAIRNGEWTLEDMETFFQSRLAHLETLYEKCTVVPDIPNEAQVRQLLYNVLEAQYGSISNLVKNDKNGMLLKELSQLVQKYS